MKYYEALAVLFLLIASFIIGVQAGANHANSYPILAMVIIVFFVIYAFEWVSKVLEKSALSYASKNILYMGRGVPTSLIRLQVVLLELGILGFLLAVAFTVAVGPGIRTNLTVPVVALSFVMLVLLALTLVRLKGSLAISSRKTSVEVEFPFLLALMKALSVTHLSLYDLLNIISESSALRAWAKEIQLAKRLSGTMSISLLQAMAIISDTHPSKTVRDTFKRIVVVGNLAGTIRDVVDRAFSYVFTKLNTRLESLVDRLDLMNGIIMFGFMFVPIILATVAPLSNMSIVSVIGVVLIMEVPMSLLTYALLTAMYPSGFSARPNNTAIALAVFSIIVVVILTGLYLAPIISYALKPHTPIEYLTNPPSPGLSPIVYTVGTLIALIPPTVVAEMLYRKIVLYSTIIRITTDAAEISASLGENFVTVFTRESYRYGARIQRLARSIVESYQTPLFRQALVSKAPTIFHASFLEALLYTLMIGAPAPVLKSLTEAYENLTKLWDKTRSVTRTLEGMIISLSAMLGFFIEYLYKMFYGFAQSIQKAIESGGQYAATTLNLLSINPTTFLVLSALTSLSVIVVSLFTGKTRGGSLLFGFRTALLSFLLYQTVSLLVLHFVHGPISSLP